MPGRSNSAVGSNPNAPSTVVTLGDMYEGKIVAGNGLRTPSGVDSLCPPLLAGWTCGLPPTDLGLGKQTS